MIPPLIARAVLVVACAPFVYYLIAIFSSWRFFRSPAIKNNFTPPVSILKPIRGIDPEAYENFASLCRQDYPEYEILFCVGRNDDRVVHVIEKLQNDFPQCHIRILVGFEGSAANDKIAKLNRLVHEARHDVIVLGDSDVRVEPDYLRSVVSPLADPNVGAATCFYMPADKRTFAGDLQSVGMLSDFYVALMVAWVLEGVKYALGATIVTRRPNLAEFGGLQAIENRPGDDLLIGRLIAECGHKVVLLPYVVQKLGGYRSIGDLLDKRFRWMIVMRHSRPWGHLGLLLTQSLPWLLLAIALNPSAVVATAYIATYLFLRACVTWTIGIHILKPNRVWKEIPLIPVWDATAFLIWLGSFFRKKIRWRDGEYYIREGKLCPVSTSPARD